jgi:hypothetical protein
MNPFANPAEAVVYEYVEFPKTEAPTFTFADFNQEFSKEASAEGSTPSGHFVDFLNLKDMPQETTTTVQLAVFQNFKDVLLPAQA